MVTNLCVIYLVSIIYLEQIGRNLEKNRCLEKIGKNLEKILKKMGKKWKKIGEKL